MGHAYGWLLFSWRYSINYSLRDRETKEEVACIRRVDHPSSWVYGTATRGSTLYLWTRSGMHTLMCLIWGGATGYVQQWQEIRTEIDALWTQLGLSSAYDCSWKLLQCLLIASVRGQAPVRLPHAPTSYISVYMVAIFFIRELVFWSELVINVIYSVSPPIAYYFGSNNSVPLTAAYPTFL